MDRQSMCAYRDQLIEDHRIEQQLTDHDRRVLGKAILTLFHLISGKEGEISFEDTKTALQQVDDDGNKITIDLKYLQKIGSTALLLKSLQNSDTAAFNRLQVQLMRGEKTFSPIPSILEDINAYLKQTYDIDPPKTN